MILAVIPPKVYVTHIYSHTCDGQLYTDIFSQYVGSSEFVNSIPNFETLAISTDKL